MRKILSDFLTVPRDISSSNLNGESMASDTFYGLDVPVPLREISERHQRHISELVTQLRDVGMDEQSIISAVDRLIDSYRTQLLHAVKAIGGSHA